MSEKHVSLKQLGVKDVKILEGMMGVSKYDGYKVRLDYNLKTNELELVVPQEDAERLREEVMPFKSR